MLDFSNLANTLKLLDKNLNTATIDRLFIATNVELVAMDDNPDKELCRFELLEILVRMSGAKYKDHGITSTYSEGLKKILEDYIVPYASTLDQWE